METSSSLSLSPFPNQPQQQLLFSLLSQRIPLLPSHSHMPPLEACQEEQEEDIWQQNQPHRQRLLEERWTSC